jgi:hypothetical protein
MNTLDMNTLDTTTTAMRKQSAMRELSEFETAQVGGGQSTESILDKCGGPVRDNG